MPCIDAHSHFCPLRFLDFAEKQEGKPYALAGMFRGKPPLFDERARLAQLDANGIDVAVLVPLPWLETFPRLGADRSAAVAAARLMNDEIARVVAAEPKRFRGVAILPGVDPDAMVEELHRAVQELRFLGGYVPVGPTVKRMDHPDYEALYRAINELDAMLWLHPSRPPIPDYADEAASQHQEWQTIGWPHDTTSAMHRIVFGGVFERYPGLRIMTHHHGGFLPYSAPRLIGAWANFEKAGMGLETKISKPYIDHFKKFLCDTAVFDFSPKVLELALDFFGPDRVLFGSDAPFGAGNGQAFLTAARRSVEAMDVSPEVRNAILVGNARRAMRIA